MGLVDFLYRCPGCGHDPLVRDGRTGRCVACGATYAPSSGGRIRITHAEGSHREVPARELGEAVDRMGGPMTAATDPDGVVRYAATVQVSRSVEMEPVKVGHEVVGFVEVLETPRKGRLVSTERDLSFLPDDGGSLWAASMDAVRALQTSSSSLQVDVGGTLYQFRFDSDSPRRWESLLRELIQREYRRQGRGEIVEYQPRIVTR